MGIEKRTYSFRLDDELVEKLRRLAARDNRKLSNMVETILKTHVMMPEGAGMPNYKKMYFYLFNAISDALALVEIGKPAAALERLRMAQSETEEMYLQDADGKEELSEN